MTKNETEVMRNQLVESGLDSYLDALTAVREFQNEIIRRSRRVLEEKLNDLSKAMGISVDEEEIKVHLSIDKLTNEELGEQGWMGIKFLKEPMVCYFGLFFNREDSECVTEVCVSMSTDKASQRDFLLKHCKKISPDFDHYHWNEIGLDMPISKDEIGNFEAKLHELIDKWIEVWKEVGGIKILSKK